MGGALHAMARPYGFVLDCVWPISITSMAPSVQFFLDLKLYEH
jgi:hypothetical protein